MYQAYIPGLTPPEPVLNRLVRFLIILVQSRCFNLVHTMVFLALKVKYYLNSFRLKAGFHRLWESERNWQREGERERERVTLNLSQYHQTLSPVSISNTGGWNARSEISTLYSLVKNKNITLFTLYHTIHTFTLYYCKSPFFSACSY